MFNIFVRKGCVFLALAVLAVLFFQSDLMAEGLILNHTGTIKVTRPDGVVLMIEPGQALPDIPTGSRVEVLSGSLEIEPSEGFIQLVLGSSVATVKAGDSVSAAIDLETGMADFKTASGEVNIVTGNTTATVKAGQQALMSLDKTTGEVHIKSIIGVIQTVTVGVKTQVFEGGLAKISVNAKTRIVHIESFRDNVLLTIVDVQGSPEGEIQTFDEVSGFTPEAEPIQPERPEGSKYN